MKRSSLIWRSPILPPLWSVFAAQIFTRTLQPIQPAAIPTWLHPVRLLGFQEGHPR